MDFLQLWFAPAIPQWRLDSMIYTWRALQPGDTYTIVCNWPRLFSEAPARTQFLAPGDLLPGWKKFPDHKWWMDYSRDNRFFSDYVRLRLACVMPELLYIDTDVRMGKLPHFDQPGAYLGQCGRFNFGDFDLFYVNRDTRFFIRLMSFCLGQKRSTFIPFLFRRELLGQYNLINPRSFARGK